MAKPRKQKNGEQQPSQSKADELSVGGQVLHQKICLSIDMQRRMVYGHTEMKVVFPENGIIGLHADNMEIRSILVNGEPTEFEFFKHYQHTEDEKWDSVSCPSSAADAACAAYISSLDREMLPNLLVSCCKAKASTDDLGCQMNGMDASHNSSGESKQLINGENGHETQENTKLVRINYCLERDGATIHFGDNVLCTDNQIRRSHCWFPCMDSSSQRCCYDLEFTVDIDYVAVSTGNLLYQILTNDNPPRKTYVYKLNIPVSAGWISLAVAPFEVFPDSHNGRLSHLCLSTNLSMLRNAVGFFHAAFSHYEEYLSLLFPFGSYKQAFVPPELLASSVSIGASVCIISSDVLFDEKVIDQIIDTRIKLAHALAKQWFGGYIIPESPSDEWLIDGLAGFLTDSYIRRFLGNNEARYRRYKENCYVCRVDVTGATALSSSIATDDLFGTQSIGLYGKIRSWKAIAVLQMLEKQMGPESFRKILQIIVYRAQDTSRSFRALSTREFRHLANKVGNLERPFLKEFFPRWVGSCGCPVLRLGMSYIKRKNMIELAVMRSSTAIDSSTLPDNPDNETQGDISWPGMMSIRVHELDGVYDHPSLPMSGETLQLLEIQLHSKLASKRFQKPKKGVKPDGSDDTSDVLTVLDAHACMDSPLQWIRVDPELEYLADIHFHQPVQMWINQLEKDRDVVAQSEAILTLKHMPQLSVSVVNALNNLLNDSKAFWRVRIEAAFVLAHLASEDSDWAGLLHLVKFYKNRRFDMDIGLPKPNNFSDIPEYFVLEAIPLAIAMVRSQEGKSPREAVEFILQLLKYNDNNGNPYSDVYWLAALVQAVGELEFGKQNISFLPSLLKRVDRLLQFDRLMPSYNGILTISCIRTLTQIASKMPSSIPLGQVSDLIKSYRNFGKRPLSVQIEANKSLLNLEFFRQGLDAALLVFINFLEEEPSFRGQVKLAIHMMRLCQANADASNCITNSTLGSLLRIFARKKTFNNFFLRHHIFCILQVIAGRPPTLYGAPRVRLPPVKTEPFNDLSFKTDILKTRICRSQEPLVNATMPTDALPVTEAAKEGDTISNNERRVLKIRVKQPSASEKVDGTDNIMETSRVWRDDTDLGPTSSVSVDAPPRPVVHETQSTGNQIVEEVHSGRNPESRMTASVGSAKVMISEEMSRDLQCTADSRNGSHPADQSPPVREGVGELSLQRHDDKPLVSTEGHGSQGKQKKEKKHKDKKRKREGKAEGKDRQDDDPEYLERKRLKKEKKRMEKELARSQKAAAKSSAEPQQNITDAADPKRQTTLTLKKPESSVGATVQNIPGTSDGNPSTKIRIRIKSRTVGNS